MFESLEPEHAPEPHAENTDCGLVVRGVHYTNSAAQFWPAFLDEINQQHPMADSLILSATGEGPLHAGMLFPLEELSNAIDETDDDFDFDLAMRGIAAEIEATGPPAAVNLDVRQEERLLERKALTELIDADIFPFLLAWLLEWSCLSDAAWNRPRLRGEFTAGDNAGIPRYDIRFKLENQHLSEGLFQRSLSMLWHKNPATPEESIER